ncbi:MAG: hypothetical protein R3223_00410 [Longimicrobiales bacterium]|nr:hypothetical protein [Longimicrobiales bacterium]
MRSIFATVCAALVLSILGAPAPASAQSAEIAQAILAAPGNNGAEATVIHLNDDGSSTVIREGSNGFMCWDSSDHAYNNWDSQCTSIENRPRVEQNHEFYMAGGSEEEIEARFQEAEENGTREVSKYGSFYFHAVGTSPDNLRMHSNIVVPFATGETLGGIPTSRQPAALWLMQAGTSSAHLMLPGGL